MRGFIPWSSGRPARQAVRAELGLGRARSGRLPGTSRRATHRAATPGAFRQLAEGHRVVVCLACSWAHFRADAGSRHATAAKAGCRLLVLSSFHTFAARRCAHWPGPYRARVLSTGDFPEALNGLFQTAKRRKPGPHQPRSNSRWQISGFVCLRWFETDSRWKSRGVPKYLR